MQVLPEEVQSSGVADSGEKLDIFQLLSAISVKNQEYLDQLPESQQKQFVPLVVARWLTGAADKRQLVFINELVNPFLFSLGHYHKPLMYKLMTICTEGRSRRYQWQAGPSKKGLSKPTAGAVLKQVYGYSTQEANDALRLLTVEQVIELAEHIGVQNDDLSKIKKEFKKK